jgi:ribosomal protein S18 acetylase RimI-like enzyme
VKGLSFHSSAARERLLHRLNRYNRTGDMKCIRYRRARPEDSFHFSELMQLSAPLFLPTLFGEKFTAVIRKLFVRPNNLFSYENAYVAECDDEIAGMILGYDYSSRWIKKDEYYISNIAVYPRYTGRGTGNENTR